MSKERDRQYVAKSTRTKVVQWLGLSASMAKARRFNSGQRTKISQAVQHCQNNNRTQTHGKQVPIEQSIKCESFWPFKIRSILCLLGSLTKVILLTVVGHKSVKSTCKLIWKSFYNLKMFIHLFTIIVFLVQFPLGKQCMCKIFSIEI